MLLKNLYIMVMENYIILIIQYFKVILKMEKKYMEFKSLKGRRIQEIFLIIFLMVQEELHLKMENISMEIFGKVSMKDLEYIYL